MTEILKPAENLILIYDTETSGFPLWKDPSEDPRQPHIVDLCAILYTPEGEIVDQMETMIRPDGWTIPDDVAAVHGITTDFATINGIEEIEAAEITRNAARSDRNDTHRFCAMKSSIGC